MGVRRMSAHPFAVGRQAGMHRPVGTAHIAELPFADEVG